MVGQNLHGHAHGILEVQGLEQPGEQPKAPLAKNGWGCKGDGDLSEDNDTLLVLSLQVQFFYRRTCTPAIGFDSRSSLVACNGQWIGM